MSKYQLRNFSLFLMRKQPVSVSVSRGFFWTWAWLCQNRHATPTSVAHTAEVAKFFLLSTSQIFISLRRFLIPTTNKWPEWYDEMIFYKFLKKLNATRRLPKNTAKVMLADWIELAEAVWLKAGGCVVGGGLGSWSQHSDWVPFVLPGQQYWPRPRSWN